jgi:hypothetical protein
MKSFIIRGCCCAEQQLLLPVLLLLRCCCCRRSRRYRPVQLYVLLVLEGSLARDTYGHLLLLIDPRRCMGMGGQRDPYCGALTFIAPNFWTFTKIGKTGRCSVENYYG